MTETSVLLAEFFKTISEMQSNVQDEITKIFQGLIDEAENVYYNYQNDSGGTKKRKIELPDLKIARPDLKNTLEARPAINLLNQKAIPKAGDNNLGVMQKMDSQPQTAPQKPEISNKIDLQSSQISQSSLIKKVEPKTNPKIRIPIQKEDKNNREIPHSVNQVTASDIISDIEIKKEAKIVDGQLIFVKVPNSNENPKSEPLKNDNIFEVTKLKPEKNPPNNQENKLIFPKLPKSDFKIINCSSMVNKAREIPLKRPKKEKPIDVKLELKRKYTPTLENIKEEIKKLYSKGIDPAIISKLYQISINLVHSIGNWGQLTKGEIRSKLDLKANVFSLLTAGASPQNICIKLNLSRGEYVNLTEEIPIYSIIKSPKAKFEFYDLIKDGNIPKQALSELTGIPQPKLWKWEEKVESNIPLSDEDSVNSDGEFSRETIKKALACLYATQSIEQAAKAVDVQNKDKILEWKRKFKEKK